MSGKVHNYEVWVERPISKVSVRYYLISPSGNSLLAVVGNKDGEGRTRYVVAKDFLEAFGSNATINAYTKWRKHSEVRKWITSFVYGDDWPHKNIDHQGDGSRINEENKVVVQNAIVDVASLNYAATGRVILTLPAPSLAHLYESGRGQKGKFPKHQGDSLSLDQEEKVTQEDLMKNSSKKLRSSLVQQKHDSVRLDATNHIPPKEQAASKLTTLKYNTDLSSIVATEQPASFQVGEKIEVLCQDSGMRGCWFTCRIVKVSKNSFKVHYNDAHNVETSRKLEEWVPASRLADPDKRGLRHSDRLTVRPCPPKEPFSHFYEVGASVESWWNSGWWESFVVTCVSLCSSNDSYHVFLPGERRFLTLHIRDIRVAKDWINNAWVAVKPNPDILSDIRTSM